MHFLITAGGTREYIDPVRFISNASSGRMGYALARVVLKRGHKVTLITAPVSLRAPVGAKVVNVETAAGMFEAVKRSFAVCDCLIMAAAVSDYTVARPVRNKIKKDNKLLAIKLKPTADILKWAGGHKRAEQIVVGFALEDKDLRARADEKMKEKHLDMIIANRPASIGADETTVDIKTAGGKWLRLPMAGKIVAAEKIIRIIENIRKRLQSIYKPESKLYGKG